MSLATSRELFRRAPTPDRHLESMGSFSNTITDKIINKDIIETTLFKSISERLEIKNK